MSIDEMFTQRLAELDGVSLVRLIPIVGSSGPSRTLWVTKEVYHAVEPIRDGTWDDYRLSEFRGSLDAFTNNEEVSVAENPFDKNSDTFLARVDPVIMELWDVRTLIPGQGIRCLGGFAGYNTFVALTWDYRELIDWRDFVTSGKTVWQSLFGNIQPFSGENLDAYLSNYISV